MGAHTTAPRRLTQAAKQTSSAVASQPANGHHLPCGCPSGPSLCRTSNPGLSPPRRTGRPGFTGRNDASVTSRRAGILMGRNNGVSVGIAMRRTAWHIPPRFGIFPLPFVGVTMTTTDDYDSGAGATVNHSVCQKEVCVEEASTPPPGPRRVSQTLRPRGTRVHRSRGTAAGPRQRKAWSGMDEASWVKIPPPFPRRHDHGGRSGPGASTGVGERNLLSVLHYSYEYTVRSTSADHHTRQQRTAIPPLTDAERPTCSGSRHHQQRGTSAPAQGPRCYCVHPAHGRAGTCDIRRESACTEPLTPVPVLGRSTRSGRPLDRQEVRYRPWGFALQTVEKVLRSIHSIQYHIPCQRLHRGTKIAAARAPGAFLFLTRSCSSSPWTSAGGRACVCDEPRPPCLSCVDQDHGCRRLSPLPASTPRHVAAICYEPCPLPRFQLG